MNKTITPQASHRKDISFQHPTDEWKQKWESPRSYWNELADFSEDLVDPFSCTPQWQIPFHEVFMPNRRLLVHRSDDSLVSLAEKNLGNQEIIITPIEANWLFGTPLLGKSPVDLLSEVIKSTRPRDIYIRRRLFISGIALGGKLQKELWKNYGDDFNMQSYSTEIMCRASLEGGVDGYMSRRSANHRRSLKKQIKRAQHKGIYFERKSPDNPDAASEIFNRMLNVELSSWKAKIKRGMEQPRPRRFYHAMLQRLTQTQDARVIFARHNENDIGYIFGGLAGNVYRGQQFSFANDWKKYSVGNLLQYQTIKWLCEEGMSRYDMGPDMPYKHHWTEQFPKINTVMIDLGHC